MLSRRALQLSAAQCRSYSTRKSSNHYVKMVPVGMVVLGGTLTFVGSFFITGPDVHAEAQAPGDASSVAISESSKGTVVPPSGSKNDLITYVWGTNRYQTTSNGQLDSLKAPRSFEAISGEGIALRDLVFHEKHAACVDASGNVYQWGEDFFGSTSSAGPEPTLKGKDITTLTLSSDKIYALSRGGKVYVIPSKRDKQAIYPSPSDQQSSWWSLNWLGFWKSTPTIDFVELKPDSKLSRSEKITSISAGRHHLLALTSSGRTLTSPISSLANSHGQLGTRKIHLTSLSPSSPTIPIEFLPKNQGDIFARSSSSSRLSSSSASTTTSPTLPDDNIRYCNTLFEIPALKGVEIAQVAASDRASYARTKNGRVLAWGANEYGQMGQGGTFAMEYIPVPTEIPISRSYPSGTNITCVDIAAGGDIAYFTVERSSNSPTAPTNNKIMDVLACGMGQFGSLGNALYTQSQGNLVKVKTISGIQEFNERTQSLQPLTLKSISASPTHHTMLTLDTLDVRSGRDVWVWGLNSGYQLGLNGKRGNIPQPTPLPSFGFAQGGATEVAGRMMLRERTVDVLRDLQGNKVKKNAKVEQTAVAGWGCSALYWKVV